MPRGDGTGPRGKGPGTGRGMGPCGGGQRGGRGQSKGQGKGLGKGAGSGGDVSGSKAGTCVCPQCGKTIPHRWGVPCTGEQCPACGSPLVRKE